MIIEKLKQVARIRAVLCEMHIYSQRDGWMDDLRFFVLLNSIPVISGRWTDDHERLCAAESRL